MREAYSEVMFAAIDQDISSPLHTANGTYLRIIPLKQTIDGWALSEDKLAVAGVSPSDNVHWLNKPRAGGKCKVYYMNGSIFLNWNGEDHINSISAADFLTKDILEIIVGNNYRYSVINSNETYDQKGGTQKFINYAQKYGFDLNDYGAKTWQIYVKEKDSSNSILMKPAIYWSSVEIKDQEMVGKFVPVMGYRDGKYDVYYAEVVTYNSGTNNQYNSLKNNFANVTDAGGSATFQFSNYTEAKNAYDKLLEAYDNNDGTVRYEDIINNGLK